MNGAAPRFRRPDCLGEPHIGRVNAAVSQNAKRALWNPSTSAVVPKGPFFTQFLRGCAYRRETRRRIEVNIPASGSLSTTPGMKVTAMATKPATAI